MHTFGQDARHVHLLTRGNVDGLVSSAFFLAAHPDGRVTYVPSASGAVDVLDRDATTRRFVLTDLGLTDDLVAALNDRTGAETTALVLDHHQQTGPASARLTSETDVVLREGPSAASVTLGHLAREDRVTVTDRFAGLAAVADLADYCASRFLDRAEDAFGRDRLEEETRVLDFAWRLKIDDDRFRLGASRRLAKGRWPSEIDEVLRRYRVVLAEDRWGRARDRAESHMEVTNGVAVLEFGRRRTSLLGFGTRALAAAARERGCHLAVLVNRRSNHASVAVRATGPVQTNLGQFLEDFTKEHGVVGGGHPESAGARVPTRHVPTLLRELYALA